MTTAPADERLDALSSDGGHGHGHGLRRGQPVRVVVAGGKVADVVDVAEHEGHGAEPAQAAASCAWKQVKAGRWLVAKLQDQILHKTQKYPSYRGPGREPFRCPARTAGSIRHR